MVLGMETVKAFGLAGDRYEGSLKETDEGVYIEFTWKRKLSQKKFIPTQIIPADAFLKDLFLAYHIKKLAEKLGEVVEKEAVKCT